MQQLLLRIKQRKRRKLEDQKFLFRSAISCSTIVPRVSCSSTIRKSLPAIIGLHQEHSRSHLSNSHDVLCLGNLCHLGVVSRGIGLWCSTSVFGQCRRIRCALKCSGFRRLGATCRDGATHLSLMFLIIFCLKCVQTCFKKKSGQVA